MEESSSEFPTSSESPMNCTRIDVALGDLTASAAVRVPFAMLYVIIFCFGVGGNVLVILAVAKNKQLQTVRNFFIVSLSISDICVCFISLPVTYLNITYKVWLFGTFLCKPITLFSGMSLMISTFTLTAIAVDRFVLIIFPTKIRPMQVRHAVLVIALIWAIALAISLPSTIHFQVVDGQYYYDLEIAKNESDPFLFCGEFCDELGWDGDGPGRKIYGTALVIVQFFVPLTIITLCYSLIVRKLNQGIIAKQVMAHKKQKVSAAMSGNPSSGSEAPGLSERQLAAWRKKQRTNYMLIAMVCLFAVVWLPQVLVNFLTDFEAIAPDERYLMALSVHCIAMTSTVWNPILYGGLNEQFRRAFIEVCPCLGCSMKARTFFSGNASSRQTTTRTMLKGGAGGEEDGSNEETAPLNGVDESSPVKVKPAQNGGANEWSPDDGQKDDMEDVAALILQQIAADENSVML